MRNKFIIIVLLFVMTTLFASCNQLTGNRQTNSEEPTIGYGDIEPPHYTQESELVEHLKKDEGLFGESLYGDVDCYYKPKIVPDIFTFAYIRPQNIYISWYYNYSDWEAKYSYFTWTADRNGQKRLEYDIKNESLNRLDDTDYYYYIIQTKDFPGIEAICMVEWVMDDYCFSLNIPADYVVKNGQPDIAAINQYTQLKKVEINNTN